VRIPDLLPGSGQFFWTASASVEKLASFSCYLQLSKLATLEVKLAKITACHQPAMTGKTGQKRKPRFPHVADLFFFPMG
jgi:hypothetical protein